MKKTSDIIGRPVGAFSQQFPGTPAEQAEALAAHGFDCVQWQPGPDALASNDAARREIEGFRRVGLPIVAVSGYNNLMARDPAQKAAALAAVERAFELAALVGPGTGVATETGMKHPETAWISDPANLLPATWE